MKHFNKELSKSFHYFLAFDFSEKICFEQHFLKT